MDLREYAAASEAEYGRPVVGTWHVLDEKLTRWSSKPTRPWLVVAEYGSGPNVQMMPRTTQDRGGRAAIRHASHDHGEFDSDRRTCAINRPGRICTSERKAWPREWIADDRAYSCREPDEALLEALGCRQ